MKIRDLLNSKLFISLSSLLLGGLATYFITDYVRLKQSVGKKPVELKEITPRVSKKQKLAPRNPHDIFDQMSKRMDRMFSNSFFGHDPFGSFGTNFGSGFQNDMQIQEHEDADFKYIEIESDGFDKDSLQVNIEDGMVSISGEIKKTNQNNGQNSWGSSSFISKFHKSFNVPFGVDESKVQIETSNNKLVIKFPKIS